MTHEPFAIFSAIDACPPLMREQAKTAYFGSAVDWILTYADGHQDASGNVRLAFHYAPHDVRMVVTTVAFSDYLWLQQSRAGEAIRVQGRISKISSLTIELEAASLSHAVEAAH
jgi:hypothetical protein